MKVVIALDSFKGSISSYDAGVAAEKGIRQIYPRAEINVFPVADGGEGTVKALTGGSKGEIRNTAATDPLGRKIYCDYAILENKTAVIEMASCSGLSLISPEERNPLFTTTAGVGDLIKDAILRGCRNFIIGIGGSATNDGGIGMLQQLGFGILDKNGEPVPFGARGLEKIASIDQSNILPQISECTFNIACDVNNPLCGEKGCSAVYGPQKGADREMILQMDRWLDRYASITKKYYPDSDRDFPGAGAAGGMGFAFMSYLGGKLIRGAELILKEIGIENYIKGADFVICGEGKIDAQTVMGKIPAGVAEMAQKYGKTVIALGGMVAEGCEICNDKGMDALFTVVRGPCDLEYAMQENIASKNISHTSEQIFRLIKAVQKGNG